MKKNNKKFENFIFNKIQNLKNPKILEFGVQRGYSTKRFLNLINRKGGQLISVDINDCSGVSKNKKWKFIQSRDDNFKLITKNIPKKVDVIFLDSLHEAKHVKKMIYYYYKYLSKNGFFFIDDICWLPYVKNSWRQNSYAEINNYETFQLLLKIFHANYKNFDLDFTFVQSGYALIKKLNDNKILSPKKIPLKKYRAKYFVKKILKKII